MSAPRYNRCANCKYCWNTAKDSDQRCHNVSNMYIRTDCEDVRRVFPRIRDLDVEAYKDPCSLFEPTIGAELRLVVSNTKLKWFKHRYPEKFI
jgi:hypothetical protein